MKKVIFNVLALFIVIVSNAQVEGGEIEKLSKLYEQGKYESCLFKADNYTYKEEYSRDPEPYLYLSMCFYQLSKSEDEVIREDYKDGVKQAIKYAAKFIKYDKDGELQDLNSDYVDELKKVQVKNIKNELNEQKFSKAATAAKTYGRLNKEDDEALNYFIGMCQILSNNLSQGSRTMEEATEKLNEQLIAKTFRADSYTKSIIVDGFLKYSEFLVGVDRKSDAIKNLDFGLKLFPDNGYLKVQKNLITKSEEKETKTE